MWHAARQLVSRCRDVPAGAPPSGGRKVGAAARSTGDARHRRTLASVLGAPVAAVALLLAAPGCVQEMADQARYEPLEASELFADGRASRPLIEGTVARGRLRIDEHRYTGKVDGEAVEAFPFEVDRQVLERGRERYEIFCTPCHGEVGNGDGLVVQRGFRRPSSFHVPRLRQEPPGYFFDVITNGFGAMSSYAAQVPVDDRWAIVAYIRALQLSQNATLDEVPDEQRARLESRR